MKILWIFAVLLVQGALGQIFRKEPESRYVTRQGQAVTLECETRQPATFCAWKLDTPSLGLTGFITSTIPANVDITARDQNSKTDCTVTINNIDTRYDGIYTCSPFTSGGAQEDANAAEVIVAQKPASVQFVGDAAGRRVLQASASDPASITCEASRARPKAELAWYIGNTQLYDGIEVEDSKDDDSNLVTSRSTLTHQYRREDNGQRVRCLANHPGYDEQDANHQVELTVDVQYKPYRPEGNNIGKIYGFTAEQPGVIVVNFTSNPMPEQMSWKIGDSTAVSAGGQSLDGRFTASQLDVIDADSGMYSLTLTIDPIKLEDQSKAFQLRLLNSVGEGKMDFSIGTGPAPPPSVMGAGTIAGIVIGLIVLLLIIGVIAIARSQGKWCFAGKTETKDAPDAPSTLHARPPKKRPQATNRRRSLAASQASLGSMGGGGDGRKKKGGLFHMPTSYLALKQAMSARPNRERMDMFRADIDVEEPETEEVTYTNEQNVDGARSTEQPLTDDLNQMYTNEPPPAKRRETILSRDSRAISVEDNIEAVSLNEPPAPNMSTLPQTPLSPRTPIEFGADSQNSVTGSPPIPRRQTSLPSEETRRLSQNGILEDSRTRTVNAQNQQLSSTEPCSTDGYAPQSVFIEPNRMDLPLKYSSLSTDQRVPYSGAPGPSRRSEGFPYPAPELPMAGSREELGIPYTPATGAPPSMAAPPLPPKGRPLSQIAPGAVRLLPSQLQSELSARFPSSPSLLDSDPQHIHGSQV